jgi:2-polyprenyl-3-methyl-5-hydroxy-6-metoxy-1,4-benzoquinol methylase
VTCPICRDGNVSEMLILHDDRYGYRQQIQVMRCDSCGHKYGSPSLAVDTIGTIYTNYYQRQAIDPANFEPYVPDGKWKGWLNGDPSSAAHWVPEKVRVLDIGCGLGSYVAFHAARGCDAHGIDADANVRAIAEQHRLNIRVGLFHHEDYPARSFDYVTMDQVFEHVTDPLATLKDVREVLKPGGYLVMSTPNANGWGGRLFGKKWLNWHVPYHQQFISRRSMAVLAEKAGFEIERMSTKTQSAWLIYQIAHLLTYPAMGEASVFWAPQKSRQRLHQFVMLKLIMATRLTFIPQLITRFFDLIGHGDNYLVILRKV